MAPGPLVAGATDLWRAYQQYNGRLRTTLLDLHVRHGPIVRYGVRSISISDPAALNIIYGSREGFITVSFSNSYYLLYNIYQTLHFKLAKNSTARNPDSADISAPLTDQSK